MGHNLTLPVPFFDVITKELKVVGSFRYGPGDYPLAISLVERGLVDLKPLVTQRYEFKDALEAFETTRAGKDPQGKVRRRFSRWQRLTGAARHQVHHQCAALIDSPHSKSPVPSSASCVCTTDACPIPDPGYISEWFPPFKVAKAAKSLTDIVLLSSAGCDLAERDSQPRLREFIDLETLAMKVGERQCGSSSFSRNLCPRPVIPDTALASFEQGFTRRTSYSVRDRGRHGKAIAQFRLSRYEASSGRGDVAYPYRF
jgi:hypothetical protein